MLKEPKKTVSVALPQECYDQIKELADDVCRTVPNYIRVIIYNYLSELEKAGAPADKWWVVK